MVRQSPGGAPGTTEEHSENYQNEAEEVRQFWAEENLGKMFAEEEAKFARVRKEKGKFPPEGIFLEKLWSAVEHLVITGYRDLQRKPIPERVMGEMGKFYDRILAVEKEKDDRVRIGKKMMLAGQLRNFAEAEGHTAPAWFTSEFIDGLARTNDAVALEELKRLKREPLPEWVRHKRSAGFSPELDVLRIRPFGARPLLEDYRRVVEKREHDKPWENK